ncbi:hypothetical protein V6N11_037101 [Hibiscus sabdariffa]|uniref:WRKY domain-containing protein n=1 Tax=Hibiscus sabdariffa TaxID=183260 RepID=A0ABR1ZXL2_9ROSI
MSWSWDTKKAIEELVQGREWTNQLRDLLTKSVGDESGLELVGSEDLKPMNNMSCCDGRKSEDSGESIKSSPSASASALTLKDRRGSYKRRKCVASRTNISSALIDDGYAWRKYGQKKILNANHPRSYYRCTHKNEQGCDATKQVQKIQDDPPKYETMYSGHHTCKNTLKPFPFIMDHNDSSKLISFSNQHDLPFFSSSSKEDYKPASDITYYNGSSSSDYILSPPHLSSFHHDGISGGLDSVADIDDFLSFNGMG